MTRCDRRSVSRTVIDLDACPGSRGRRDRTAADRSAWLSELVIRASGNRGNQCSLQVMALERCCEFVPTEVGTNGASITTLGVRDEGVHSDEPWRAIRLIHSGSKSSVQRRMICRLERSRHWRLEPLIAAGSLIGNSLLSGRSNTPISRQLVNTDLSIAWSKD